MIKNYSSLIFPVVIGVAFLLGAESLLAQELKIFKRADFDLVGPVKHCLVITKYGKEEFSFNEEGLLTKSITRYNDSDYDITQYTYESGHLLEKRIENYRDDTFDRNTSIVHLYEIDTTANKKINERIISYNKDFLGNYKYIFNADGQMVKIIKNTGDGIDETVVNYSKFKGESTVKYVQNGVIQKTVRTSTKRTKLKTNQRIVLTKKYLKGEPLSAREEVFGSDTLLLSEILFNYSPEEKQFVPENTISYSYADMGVLSAVTTKTENTESVKEYVYQFDGTETKNWIKQIITPDNTYTTRKITYFEPEAIKEED